MHLKQFFEKMLLIRTFELKLLDLYSQGLIRGTVHTCIGQEACAVGVMSALDREIDCIFSSHRAHGHIIAYGCPIDRLLAEILGRASGICGGLGGSQHLYWKNFLTTGVQGGLVPVAVGAALAEKQAKSGAVVVIFLGDGTMGQGILYEGFNLASLWRLPVLFILENNQYAQSTPCAASHAGKLEARAEPFGIPSVTVDGNDVELVHKTVSLVVRTVRESFIPHFVALNTYRLGPHSKGDDPRPQDEIDGHWQMDPLLILGNRLTKKVRVGIELRIRSFLDTTFNRVLDDPIMSLDEFMSSLPCSETPT